MQQYGDDVNGEFGGDWFKGFISSRDSSVKLLQPVLIQFLYSVLHWICSRCHTKHEISPDEHFFM